MLLLLPCIAYALLYRILRKKDLEWRQASLTAAVLCGACVALFTEALSIPRLISRGPLALCWFALCLACFFYLRINGQTTPSSSSPRENKISGAPLDRPLRTLLGVCVVIVAIVAVIAL